MSVAKPGYRIRRQLASTLLRGLDGAREASSAEVDEALSALVEQTEGLLLVDLSAIIQLGHSEGLSLPRVADAVRRYKVGVTEDPWARIDPDKIRHGADFIRTRVKGQDHAVTHVLDIVKRAVTGVGKPRRGNRPRGVAFLAGPTGVGKTELAKTLTNLLFGDDAAYIRFDMSEFSAEYSDQRLIGARPGYLGYDVGGELTNAIREKPFCVLLFDEIEKAAVTVQRSPALALASNSARARGLTRCVSTLFLIPRPPFERSARVSSARRARASSVSFTSTPGCRDVAKDAADHALKDFGRDPGPHEVEHEHVVTDPVQNLGPVQHRLEVALDLGTHAGLHHLVCVVGRDIGDARSVRLEAVDPEVRGEHDERFREVDPIAAPRGEHAVVEDL